MRKYLIEKIPGHMMIKEKTLSIEELQDAEEVFLSNAVYGMRWVNKYRNKIYRNTYSDKIFKLTVLPLWK